MLRHYWRTATFETVRRAFLEIAVRLESSKTRIKIALPSAYPHVQALSALATSIAARASMSRCGECRSRSQLQLPNASPCPIASNAANPG
jgi:hypothetical protein